MKLRFAGTGDSAQVPCFGCDCLACQRARLLSYHRREPCCGEIEIDDELILIDAGRMDLAARCERQRPAAILLTHYHADHVQGLLHLRWGRGKSIPVHGPKDPQGCADLHKNPGILDFQPGLKPFRPLVLGGLTVTPLPLNHSKPTLGYALDDGVNRVAWLCDTVGLPGATERFLSEWRPHGVVIDATHPDAYHSPNPESDDSPHPESHTTPRNHNNVAMALEIIERLSPSRAWLTHISHELDADFMATSRILPAGVELAADGSDILF
ncbi:phosphonate metabolism protein PhnP [Salinicola halophyticus]|uniref:phosphonate metabolism protein PhnP n=1 Tax=Salinicola halophyticus TaxID=1808881 RepID=UPI000DA1F52C|nr:phosphonate metabolism protein PhnP [Salinicola halophyticus]